LNPFAESAKLGHWWGTFWSRDYVLQYEINRDRQAAIQLRTPEEVMEAPDIDSRKHQRLGKEIGAVDCATMAYGGGKLFGAAASAARAAAGKTAAAAARRAAPSGPLHHLATNKNWISTLRGGPWSPRFEAIFKKAGMTLEDAANKVRIPGHFGPHPEGYHAEIFRRLRAATNGLKDEAYRKALLNELEAIRREALTPGSLLYRLLRGGAM